MIPLTASEAFQGEQQGIIRSWDNRSFRLMSWWDMKPFPVYTFLSYVRQFQKMVSESNQREDRVFSKEQRAREVAALTGYAFESNDYSLTSTSDQFMRMATAMENGATDKQLDEMLPDLMNRLEDECGRRKMMMIEPEHAKYAENPQFFDPVDVNANKVSTEFPSASEDIAEAGMCLACGRSTACVMHLLRVVECGLKALAKALGVAEQNDWGKYLAEIDLVLETRLKTSGARSVDEQFYAEVHLTFDAVRRAWRNPTMHVEKTYTVERAEEIMISVRSFMRHLATKLHD
jgi:hypothetical protein